MLLLALLGCPPASDDTAAAWFTETTEPADPLRYRLELGVSTL